MTRRAHLGLAPAPAAAVGRTTFDAPLHHGPAFHAEYHGIVHDAPSGLGFPSIDAEPSTFPAAGGVRP